MPNFDVQVQGVTVQDWADPLQAAVLPQAYLDDFEAWKQNPIGDPPNPSTYPGYQPLRPSRLNARVERRNKRWVGRTFRPIFVRAVVDGAVGPPDTELGGNTFSSQIVEAPHTGITAVIQTGGFSSVCRFLPMWPGHYTMGLWRKNGGGLILHFDVTPTTPAS